MAGLSEQLPKIVADGKVDGHVQDRRQPGADRADRQRKTTGATGGTEPRTQARAGTTGRRTPTAMKSERMMEKNMKKFDATSPEAQSAGEYRTPQSPVPGTHH